MSTVKRITVAQAIEEASDSATTGHRFLTDALEEESFTSHRELAARSARAGGALQALGARRGDRIALILPGDLDFVLTFFGAVRAGMIPVPMYPPIGLGAIATYLENTLHIVKKSGARFIVTTGEIRRILGTIQSKAPDVAEIISLEMLWENERALLPAQVTLDDPCFIQFTSGSTSRPKGVIVTHGNLAANARCIMDGLEANAVVDVGVSWLPFYHDMGLIGFVIAPIFNRISVTFMSPLAFLKRPARWLQAMSKYKGNITFGPNFAYALAVKRATDAELAGLDLSAWQSAGCGAEPIRSDDLLAFAKKMEPYGFDRRAFRCCFGMAESTLAVSFSRRGDGVKVDSVDGDALWERGLAQPVADGTSGAAGVVSCGPAFEEHTIAVFAPDDAESQTPLPERSVGEVRLRGPSVSPGYFEEPERTRDAFAGGWLRTGDLGYLANGELFICGRIKELIIVNGRNYFPQDLEWEAGKVEGVRKGNVVAFGTMAPDNTREHVVIACETPSAGDTTASDGIAREVRGVVQSALGLTVDDVVILEPGVLPKTSSGKLQRSKTRELYERGALENRTSARKVDRLEAAKELAKSQVAFFRHALLGGRAKRD